MVVKCDMGNAMENNKNLPHCLGQNCSTHIHSSFVFVFIEYSYNFLPLYDIPFSCYSYYYYFIHPNEGSDGNSNGQHGSGLPNKSP